MPAIPKVGIDAPNRYAKSLCNCIKKVRKTIKLRKGQKNTPRNREGAAIGICVKSVLQTRGKTIKKFRCGKKPFLQVQNPK
jgi:hypothetical protein